MTETDKAGPQFCRSALFRWLYVPQDIASLAAFRILFGLLMVAAMIRFMAKGWVTELYVQPRFHFPYDGFSWVRALPGEWMYGLFVGLTILALLMAIGLCYRVSTLLFFLGFTYVELIDQTAYLNHYYLVSLLSGLLIFLPAHRAWSMDVWLNPSLKLDVIPAWNIRLLRFQVAVVYIFAGLAKLNPDWLLRAEPLRIWLAARSDLPLIGPLLEPVWVAYAASWFGAIYDLTIVFFLLRPRTRSLAFLAVIFFHMWTWVLLNIGMFPWIMIVSSTVCFCPDWPRRFFSRCDAKASWRPGNLQSLYLPKPREESRGSWKASFRVGARIATLNLPLRWPDVLAQSFGGHRACQFRRPLCPLQLCAESCDSWNGATSTAPRIGAMNRWAWGPLGVSPSGGSGPANAELQTAGSWNSLLALRPEKPRLLLATLVAYATVQILLPLRPYVLGGGHPAWSYRGFNLAWQVMVAEKTGYVEFFARDSASGRQTRIPLRDYLTPRQELLMAQDPALVRVLARKISANRREQAEGGEEIVVNAFASLNGRPSQRIVDPATDLTKVSGQEWILPLRQ